MRHGAKYSNRLNAGLWEMFGFNAQGINSHQGVLNAIDFHLRAVHRPWMACPVFNEEICCVCQERLSFWKTLGEGFGACITTTENWQPEWWDLHKSFLEVVAFIVSCSSWCSFGAKWISLKSNLYLEICEHRFYLTINVLSLTFLGGIFTQNPAFFCV